MNAASDFSICDSALNGLYCSEWRKAAREAGDDEGAAALGAIDRAHRLSAAALASLASRAEAQWRYGPDGPFYPAPLPVPQPEPFYPSYPAQAAQPTALENAEKLQLLLSENRTAHNVAIFIQAQKSFHDAFLGTLVTIIQNYVGRRATPVVMRIVSAAQLTLQAEETLQGLLQYQQATTPDRITGFYGEPIDAQKVFAAGPDGKMVPIKWRLTKGKWHQLRYGVVLNVPGGPVLTAGHLARKLSDRLQKALEANNFRFVMALPQVRQWIDQAFNDGLIAALNTVRAASVLDFGFHPNPTWLSAPVSDEVVTLPGGKMSVEIGSIKVVQIVRGYNKAVIDIQDSSGRWWIKGVQKGETSFRSVFDPHYQDIAYGGPKITRDLMIEIVGDDESVSADRSEPPVAINSGLVAPILPAPHLDPPPLPKPPDPPPLPPAPAAPPALPKLPKICTYEMSQTDPDCIPH